jgi:rhodanese-related sulfurtransferase
METSMTQTDFVIPQVPSITPQAAHEEMAAGNVVVIDVRPAEAFDGGHIRGATSIPFDDLPSSAQQLLPDTGARILVYCQTGIHAALAVDYLLGAGYTDVVSFGGIESWPYEVVQ